MNEESNSSLIRAYVGAFTYIQVTENEHESILEFLHAPKDDSSLTSIMTRYQEISAGTINFDLFPATPVVLDKIVWPLRHAKGSYMLGNYLGTISLCGAVAEMLAILISDMSKSKVNDGGMNEKDLHRPYRNTFEEFGQKRRIKELKKRGLISDNQKQELNVVTEIRRRYLHFLSEPNDNIAVDAVKCFRSTVKCVVTTLIIGMNNGAIVLHPSFRTYLEEKGEITSNPPSPDEPTNDQ